MKSKKVDNSFQLTSLFTSLTSPSVRPYLKISHTVKSIKKASQSGNIRWSPVELWKSGNPWQCDFCFSLCIKSRCQEPSPPQLRTGAVSTLHLCPSTHYASSSTSSKAPMSVYTEQLWPERRGKKKCHITQQRARSDHKLIWWSIMQQMFMQLISVKDDVINCAMWKMTSCHRDLRITAEVKPHRRMQGKLPGLKWRHQYSPDAPGSQYSL